jgi:ALG6, ALG8 glycosyltransferase family
MRPAGLLVWSVALLERQRDLAAAAVFAALLNMKHLFAAAAPLYFVYLLSRSCRWASKNHAHRQHQHNPVSADLVLAFNVKVLWCSPVLSIGS